MKWSASRSSSREISPVQRTLNADGSKNMRRWRGRSMGTLPLFPELELMSARVDAGHVVMTLKNSGAFTICTRTYGQPEYRLIAKLFAGDAEVQDRWLSLPRDLAPGEIATLTFPRR